MSSATKIAPYSMDALILAAGRGARMGALTASCPKPLLKIGERSLIEHQILRLKRAGISNIIINTAWLGEMIEDSIGDGSLFGVAICYSHEPEGALETAGGIANALSRIRSDPFVVVNGDVWIDRHYTEMQLLQALDTRPELDAHLVLAENPPYHPDGDFYLLDNNLVIDDLNTQAIDLQHTARRLTFTGIGVYRKRLFEDLPAARYPLGPLLREAMTKRKVSGEFPGGRWVSVDTEERLKLVTDWQKASAG